MKWKVFRDDSAATIYCDQNFEIAFNLINVFTGTDVLNWREWIKSSGSVTEEMSLPPVTTKECNRKRNEGRKERQMKSET